jgi:hypothetical protein
MVRIRSKMKIDEYESYAKGRVPTDIDSPYFFCYYQIIYVVANFQKKYGWNFKTEFSL